MLASQVSTGHVSTGHISTASLSLMGDGRGLPHSRPPGGDPLENASSGSPARSPTSAAHQSSGAHSDGDDASPQAAAAMDMNRAMALITGRQSSRKVRPHPRDSVLTHRRLLSVLLSELVPLAVNLTSEVTYAMLCEASMPCPCEPWAARESTVGWFCIACCA